MSRVVIFSASVGAGHDSAAKALADRLTARGVAADRHDFLTLMPAGRAVCGSYRRIITHAPALYQCIYSRTERAARPGLVQRHLLRGAEQAVLAAIPPDAVAAVATYPLAAQVLGRLRASGRLAVPVVVTFTDFSVHPLWIAPGVDLYLAPHAVTAAQAVAHGVAAERVVVARPLVSGRFGEGALAGSQGARVRFGVDGSDKPLALLLGGSWGVGDVEQTAHDLAASGVVTPVVVCGRNEVLRGRLRAAGFPHVFGWVGDMATLMAACDVMVQNAGASSTLEAFATGLPVATYRSLVGHGRTNAAVLDEAGLAVWVRSRAELAGTLLELTAGVRGRRQRNAGLAMIGDGAEPAALIMELMAGATAGGRGEVADGGRRGAVGAAVAV